MNPIEQREEDVIADMLELDDRLLQYEYLLSFIECQKALPEDERSDESLVRSCSSRSWVKISVSADDTVSLESFSDALVTRGLLGVLTYLIDGARPYDIGTWTPSFTSHKVFRRYVNTDRKAGIDEIVARVKSSVCGKPGDINGESHCRRDLMLP